MRAKKYIPTYLLDLILIFTGTAQDLVAKNPYKVVILDQTVVSKEPGRYLGWPSIAKLPDGRLAVVYSGDRDWHVCPWGKTKIVFSDDAGISWSAPKTLPQTPLDDRGAGILVTQEGTILVSWFTSMAFADTNSPFYATRYYVYANHASSIDAATRDQWKGSWICRSEDGGNSWGAPIKLPRSNSPHGPIQLRSGRILTVTASGVAASDDDGLTWTAIADFPYKDYGRLSEMSSVELEDDQILTLNRAIPLTQFGSTNGGASWSSPPVPTGMNGYPPHIIRLENGWLVTVYGRRDSEPYGEFACISVDGGVTWDTTNEITLAIADKFRGTEEELGYSPIIDMGYPCSVLLDDGTIWTVYYQTDREGEWPCIMGTHWRLGALVAQTTGGNDPEDADFTFSGSGTVSTGSGNDGEDYWYTRSTQSATYLYTADPSDFQDAQGWTATYRTKVIPGNTSHFTDNFFAARNGACRFDLSIFGGSDTNAAGVYALLKTGYTRIDTNPGIDVTKYHTYQIVFDPDTDSASYHVDGTRLATYPETAMYTTSLAELRWGDQSAMTTSSHENRYSLVRLGKGKQRVSVDTLIKQTTGENDPADAGFTFGGSGTYTTGRGYDGEDYWYTRSTRSAYYLYSANVSDFQHAEGWTATYRTKVNPTNATNFTDNFFAVRNGTHRFDLSIFGGSGTNAAGIYVLLTTGFTRIDSPAIDVAEYHTYQISYNPDTAAASYYVDGNLLATYPETALYTTSLAELRWGDQSATITDVYENRYSLVSLEKGHRRAPKCSGLLFMVIGSQE